MKEFAWLHRFYRVDPIGLTVRRYEGFVSRMAEITEAESGKVDHTTRVQVMRMQQLEAD